MGSDRKRATPYNMEDDKMRITPTLLVVFLALTVVVLDYQLDLGIVAFLSDFFIVFVVVAVFTGAIGIKMGR